MRTAIAESDEQVKELRELAETNVEGGRIKTGRYLRSAADTIQKLTQANAEREELAELIVWADAHLDACASDGYKAEPLAQDWARVAKASEEVGEAIDALIGISGQNPRKGKYGTIDDLLNELADVALTGMYAMQHFTKNGDAIDRVLARARYHKMRIESHPLARDFLAKIGGGK